VADRSVSISVTLSDEGRGMTGQNFLADLHNYAHTVWYRMAEFSTITQVREAYF